MLTSLGRVHNNGFDYTCCAACEQQHVGLYCLPHVTAEADRVTKIELSGLTFGNVCPVTAVKVNSSTSQLPTLVEKTALAHSQTSQYCILQRSVLIVQVNTSPAQYPLIVALNAGIDMSP